MSDQNGNPIPEEPKRQSIMGRGNAQGAEAQNNGYPTEDIVQASQPEMPAPEMPAPEMPAPEMPAPEMPAPEMPMPTPQFESPFQTGQQPAVPVAQPEPAPVYQQPAAPTYPPQPATPQYQMMNPPRVSSLAAAYEEEEPEPKSKPNVLLIVLVVVLSLVLVGLVGAIVYKVSSGGGVTASQQQETNQKVPGANEGDNQADQKKSEDVSGDKKDDQDANKDDQDSNKDPKEQKYPASGTIEKRSAVLAGSGNLWCQLDDDKVSCTVEKNEYESRSLEGCGGNPVTFVLTKDKVELKCDAQVPRPTDKMDYDHTAVKGNMACNLTTSGMTCWDMVSGKSVFISRESWNESQR